MSETTPQLVYSGWGYEQGHRANVVHIFDAGDGLVLGVVNARWEADHDENGLHYFVTWDRVGTLPAPYADPRWPPPGDCVLGELTDEQQDEYYDQLREDFRALLRD